LPSLLRVYEDDKLNMFTSLKGVCIDLLRMQISLRCWDDDVIMFQRSDIIQLVNAKTDTDNEAMTDHRVISQFVSVHKMN